MAPLKLISLSVGSLLLLQGAHADPKYDYVEAKCENDLKTAREAVGLKEFTALKDTDKPLTDAANTICPFLTGAAESEPKLDDILKKATIAYVKQEKEKPDCAAAVASFKEGYKAVKELGTKYLANTTALSTNTTVQNFMFLYNPKENASAKCAFFVCKTTGGGGRRLSEAKDANALVCATSPAAIEENTALFSENQYNTIMKALDPTFVSAATAAVPTVFALAAAAVGIAFL